MAMTKKEKAEFDAAILKAEQLAALRWTGKVEFDLDIPQSASYLQDAVFGWSCNARSNNVFETWSEYGRHGEGRDNKRTGSQNGIKQYSTQVLALKALRHELEHEYANNLLSIDKRIERLKVE